MDSGTIALQSPAEYLASIDSDTHRLPVGAPRSATPVPGATPRDDQDLAARLAAISVTALVGISLAFFGQELTAAAGTLVTEIETTGNLALADGGAWLDRSLRALATSRPR